MPGTVPVFDLREFERDKEGFAQRLGEAFRDYGFVRIKGHGIPEKTLQEAEDATRDFFRLPKDVKAQYLRPEHKFQVGWNDGREIAAGQSKPDAKEYFMVHRDLPDGHDYADDVPPTPDVTEQPDFKDKILELYDAFEGLTRDVMRPLSMFMGMDEDWFEDKNQYSDSPMRMIHYPSGGDAKSHTDLSFLTWLRAEEPGLYVTTRFGEEIPVVAEEGELILNGGKMLALLTNNYFEPSWHRVEVKSKDPRQTIVYFANPNPDFMLDVLPAFKNHKGGLENEDWFQKLPDFPLPVQDFMHNRLGHNFKELEHLKDAPEGRPRKRAGQKPPRP